MNPKIFFRFLGLGLLFFAIPATAWSQQELAYQLKKDDFFKIEQKAQQRIVQELEGSMHELTNDLEAIFTFKVIQKNESNFIIQMAFEDFGMKTTSNLQGVLIDVKASQPVEGDMVSEIFAGLVGYQLQMTLGKSGKIEEVKGGNELVENMISKASITDDFTKNLMRKSLEKEFSSVGLAKSFEQMTYFYPETPVSVGDVWKNEFTGKLKAKNNWKLEALDSTEGKIQGNSNIIVDTNENGTVMSLTGTQQTAIITNAENGFIKTIASESFAEGVSKMPQMGNVDIPTSIKSTISYKLIQ